MEKIYDFQKALEQMQNRLNTKEILNTSFYKFVENEVLTTIEDLGIQDLQEKYDTLKLAFSSLLEEHNHLANESTGKSLLIKYVYSIVVNFILENILEDKYVNYLKDVIKNASSVEFREIAQMLHDQFNENEFTYINDCIFGLKKNE